MQRLRERWVELSFEKKLTVVFMPIVLTLLGALLPILFPRVVGDASAGKDRARLEIEALRPKDMPPEPGVEIVISNSGSRVSVINGALLDVTAIWRPTLCAHAIDPDYLPQQKHKYFVDLSQHPETPIRVDIDQVIEPQDVDRFFIGVVPKVGDVNEAPVLYRIGITLLHDGPHPLDAGQLALALPQPDEGTFSSVGGHSPNSRERACLAHETDRFLEALSDSAISRSPDLIRLVDRLQKG